MFELSKEFLEKIEEAIENNDAAYIHESMADMFAADITTVLYELDDDQSKYIIDLLDVEVGAEIISNLDTDTRKKFLKVFTVQEIAKYLYYMDSDDAVDILSEQPVKIREEIIAQIDDTEVASNILDLLRYEKDCAGGLMAKELIKANVNWTIVQCIEEIRRQAENVEKILSVYVVDNNDRLLGRVSLKRIILSTDKTLIADIFEKEIVSIESYRDVEEVADVMQRYDLEAIPVVNVQGKLLGRITIDDIIDVITEQAEKDQQIMSGISEVIEEDDSIWIQSRSRLPWLLIGMVGGLFGAKLIGLFENDLSIIPAMAFFIPLITATGGNVGIQSSTVVVQSLANKSYLGNQFFKRVSKVFLVALINAIIISSVVFTFVLLNEPMRLASVVAIALFSVVLLASFMGTVTPLLLDKIGINPALASGPFITTANDLLGLGVYFSVAHMLYNL